MTDVRTVLAGVRNCSVSPNDLHAMEVGTNAGPDCREVREMISALADGEATAADREVITHHLETCRGCQTFSLAVARLDRQIRIRPAEPVPNLVAAVTARARPARLGRGGWMRPALAWVAVVMFVQSVPMLLVGDVVGVDAHYARHLGAFGTALAIGFAYAAWRPHRAFGLLPFTVALVATTIVSLVADILSGTRTPLAELIHLSEVIGLALLWMIAGSPGWGRVSRRSSRLSRLDPVQ
ncbi:MAG TPA: zf-HC2 domain-containing protein [Ilumatobacteraceae bacterium]|nr:zf-HC2 domain-containing protein [Ilumatobacteraceae bacterium]